MSACCRPCCLLSMSFFYHPCCLFSKPACCLPCCRFFLYARHHLTCLPYLQPIFVAFLPSLSLFSLPSLSA
jgi:hypothetical protein